MFVLIGAAGVCLASVLAMIYGGVIFLGAFISDDEATANGIAAHGLIFVGMGVVGLLAVIVVSIWWRRRYFTEVEENVFGRLDDADAGDATVGDAEPGIAAQG